MILSFFSGIATAQTASEQNQLDFRKIILHAKEEVFPALIFVKPIVEEFTSGEKKQLEVFGSGVLISPDGFAVTNWHVIDKAVKINCVLFDKRQVEVALIGSDRDTDLALIKLPYPEGYEPYPYAEFWTGTVNEGDFVMALGSPFGFQRSISLGIVSNSERYLGFESEYKYNTWIQTDASINPGNSGGPLINTDGKIVGINTLGIDGSGLGFSIPGNMVQQIVARLKEKVQVERAFTGLRLQALQDFHSNTFVDSDHGVLITGVEDSSPAAAVGIRAGDILLAVGGQKVEGRYAEDLPEIWCLLADLSLEAPVAMTLARGSETMQVTVAVELKGKLEGEDFECRRWNMTVKEINKYRTPRLFYLKPEGVYIQGVKYPGNASTAGLYAQDIVLKIDNQEMTSIADVKALYEKILKDEKRDKKVMVEIMRGGLRKWIVMDYTRDYDKG